MAFPSKQPQPATYEDILRLPENVVGEIVDGDREQGVVWLWFVDPSARTIEVLNRTEHGWMVAGTFGGAGEARVPPFDAVAIDLGALWDLTPPPATTP